MWLKYVHMYSLVINFVIRGQDNIKIYAFKVTLSDIAYLVRNPENKFSPSEFEAHTPVRQAKFSACWWSGALSKISKHRSEGSYWRKNAHTCVWCFSSSDSDLSVVVCSVFSTHHSSSFVFLHHASIKVGIAIRVSQIHSSIKLSIHQIIHPSIKSSIHQIIYLSNHPSIINYRREKIILVRL